MNVTARVSRLSAPGQEVAVFLVAFASIVIMGCASAPPQQQAPIELPAWEDEQVAAVFIGGAQYISRKNFILRRNINERGEIFAYEAYLYDFPVRRMYADSVFADGGFTARGFPRQGSRDSQIMWESIRHFKRESGARPGDYISIWIRRSLTQDDFDNSRPRGGILFLHFVGRIEADGGIRGNTWRRP